MSNRRIVLGWALLAHAFAFVGPTRATAQQSGRAARSAEAGRERESALVTAAARVAPSVVSVNVVRRERRVAGDPFELFFMPRGYEQIVQGVGSGVLISADGVVITKQHV